MCHTQQPAARQPIHGTLLGHSQIKNGSNAQKVTTTQRHQPIDFTIDINFA